jgi:hypothetical protein
MSLSNEEADRIRSASDRDLIRGAGTTDLAVVVEANLRLKQETSRLSGILIWLNGILVVLTIVLIVIGVVPLFK